MAGSIEENTTSTVKVDAGKGGCGEVKRHKERIKNYGVIMSDSVKSSGRYNTTPRPRGRHGTATLSGAEKVVPTLRGQGGA